MPSLRADPIASRFAFKALGLACLVLGSASLQAFAEVASSKELKGAQITTVLKDKYVSDDHHWGHHYLADGCVMIPESGRDSTGQWSVRHDQLCLLKPQISMTKPICYAVQRLADQLRGVDDMKGVVYQGYVRGRAAANCSMDMPNTDSTPPVHGGLGRGSCDLSRVVTQMRGLSRHAPPRHGDARAACVVSVADPSEWNLFPPPVQGFMTRTRI